MSEGLFAAYALILLCAAGEDIWRLRISNIFPIAVVALFLLTNALLGVPATIWQNVVCFFAVLAVGMLLFARQWLGGGDVKLFAAVALWCNFSGIWQMIFWITVAGGVLGFTLIVARRLYFAAASGPSTHPVMVKKGPVPYGMAIATGGIIAALASATSPDIMVW